MDPPDQGTFSFQVHDPDPQLSSSAPSIIGSRSFNQTRKPVPCGTSATATASSRSNVLSRLPSRFNISLPATARTTTSSHLNIFSRSATRFNTSAITHGKEDNQSQDKSISSKSSSSGKNGSQCDPLVRPYPSSAPQPQSNEDSDSNSDGDIDEERRLDAGCEQIQDILDGLWEMSEAPRQLQTEFDKLQKGNKHVRKKLRRERDRSERLEEKLETLRSTLEASRTAAQDSALKADEAQEANKRLSTRFGELQEEVKSLGDSITLEKSEHKNTQAILTTKLEEHKMEVNGKDAVLRKVEKELEYTQKQFEDVVVKRESVVAERDQSRAEAGNLYEQITDLKKTVTSLEQTIEDERDCSRLTIANQKEMIDKIQLENSRQREKTENLQSSLHCCEGEISRLQKVFADTKDDIIAIKELQRDFDLAVQSSFETTGLRDIFSIAGVVCFPLGQSTDQCGEHREDDEIDINAISDHLALCRKNLARQFSTIAQRETIFSSCLSEIQAASRPFKGSMLRAKKVVQVTKRAVESSRECLAVAMQKFVVLSQSICRTQDEWLTWMKRACERLDKLMQENKGINEKVISCEAILHQKQQELQSVEKQKAEVVNEYQKRLETSEGARNDTVHELELYRNTMKEQVGELQEKNGVTEFALNEAKASLKLETMERTKVSRELKECLVKVKNAEDEAEQATRWAHDVQAEMEKKLEEINRERGLVVAEKERLQAELSACTSKLTAASRTARQFKSWMQIREETLTGPQAADGDGAEVSQEVKQVLLPAQGHVGRGNLSSASNEDAGVLEQRGDETAKEPVMRDGGQDAHFILRTRPQKRQQRGSTERATKTKRSRVKPFRAAEGDDVAAAEKPKRSHITDADDDNDWMVQDSTLGI